MQDHGQLNSWMHHLKKNGFKKNSLFCLFGFITNMYMPYSVSYASWSFPVMHPIFPRLYYMLPSAQHPPYNCPKQNKLISGFILDFTFYGFNTAKFKTSGISIFLLVIYCVSCSNVHISDQQFSEGKSRERFVTGKRYIRSWEFILTTSNFCQSTTTDMHMQNHISSIMCKNHISVYQYNVLSI